MDGQIQTLRKKLGKLDNLKRNKLKNDEVKDRLYNKYKMKEKGLLSVIEEIKQRIIAKT